MADLRDLFAIHFAAALVREQRYSIEFISGRAYDLADAMMAERERRIEAAFAEREASASWEGASPGFGTALLDEPAPPPSERDDLDPRWFEPPYDPAWDLEKWSAPRSPDSAEPRPGLARTNGDTVPDSRRRTG